MNRKGVRDMVNESEAKKEFAKGWVAFIGAVLTAAKIILNQFGWEIPDELIDDTVNFLLAAVTIWAAWRNNYLTNKGKKQFHLLKNANLH